jgi:hypothetical protein
VEELKHFIDKPASLFFFKPIAISPSLALGKPVFHIGMGEGYPIMEDQDLEYYRGIQTQRLKVERFRATPFGLRPHMQGSAFRLEKALSSYILKFCETRIRIFAKF